MQDAIKSGYNSENRQILRKIFGPINIDNMWGTWRLIN